jgi:ABC-type antimicrobial peptide transport system permease subunit
MRPVAIGLALGVALAMGPVMASLLHGVPPRDPLTFALVALVLCAAAIAAVCIPSRRASCLDPIVALKAE